MSATAGLILAGGLSSRMGRDKAFVMFDGTPLVEHAVRRLRPQVERLAISANGDAARFAAFGCPVVADLSGDFPGPLAGILAGLHWAARQGFPAIVTAPCDAPFLPTDLVVILQSDSSAVLVAEGPHGREPLFARWPVACMAALREAMCAGERTVHRVQENLGARSRAIVDTDPPWWLNLNTPDDLHAAESRVRRPPS